MIRQLFILPLLVFSYIARADLSENKVVEEVRDAVPEMIEDFFKPVPHPWSAQIVFELPTYNFYLGAPSIKGLSYQPNVAPQLGLKLLYKGLGTTLAFSLPIPDNERERRGDSNKTNIIINSYWRENAVDVYYQKFRGFYVASPLTEIDSDKPDRYPQLPDAQVVNYGFNWYHARNPARYSLKAAFSQSEFQTRSGGSYLHNPFYNRLTINLGDRLILGSDPGGLQSIPKLDAGRFHTLGWGFGYGYTHIRNYFFAGALVSLAPALQFQHIEREDARTIDAISWALKGNMNLATGWNYDGYVFGVKILVDSLYARVSGTELWSSLLRGQAFFGTRF